MTEVRVHAAFSVEDEDLFLSEAKKMILATQVSGRSRHCYEFSFRKRKAVSTISSTRSRERIKVMP